MDAAVRAGDASCLLWGSFWVWGFLFSSVWGSGCRGGAIANRPLFGEADVAFNSAPCKTTVKSRHLPGDGASMLPNHFWGLIQPNSITSKTFPSPYTLYKPSQPCALKP